MLLSVTPLNNSFSPLTNRLCLDGLEGLEGLEGLGYRREHHEELPLLEEGLVPDEVDAVTLSRPYRAPRTMPKICSRGGNGCSTLRLVRIDKDVRGRKKA